MTACRTIADDGTYVFHCTECALQFGQVLNGKAAKALPVPSGTSLSDRVAEENARTMAEGCEAIRRHIRKELAGYGDAIYLRWKKKTKIKRAAAILEVDPKMELLAHFEARLISESAVEHEKRVADFATAKKSLFQVRTLPYLNVETLKDDPMRLLSLLHYRSCSELEDWVSYDMARLNDLCRRAKGNAPTWFHANCLIMRGKRFGELVPFEQEKCHSLQMVGFPTAFNILQMQYRILSFLQGMVNNILGLHAMPSGHGRWRSLLSAGFKLTGSVECWSHFANPFASPPSFNPELCLQQVTAHLSEAEDHLRLLQTSPEYLQSTPGVNIEDVAVKHRQRTHGKTNALYMSGGRAIDTLLRPLEKVINLRRLLRQCAYVANARKPSPKSFKQPSHQPVFSYDRALAGLYQMTRALCDASKTDLGEILAGSDEFCSRYRISPGQVPFMPNQEHVQLFHTDRLAWLLHLIFSLKCIDNSIMEASCFAWIEEHLEKADLKERSRVDSDMYRHLSTTALYQQIQTNIALSRPEVVRNEDNFEFYGEIEPTKAATQPDMSKLYAKLRSDIKMIRDHRWPKGRRDQAWLTRAEEVRGYTSNVWETAREVGRVEFLSIGYSESLVAESVAGLDADRSAEYLAEVAAERADVLQRIAEREGRTASAIAPVPVQTYWGESDNNKIELAVDRCKPKTRPVEPVLSAPATESPDGIEKVATEAACHISVSAESLRILSRLFPTGSSDYSKGIVKWQQIVTALCDAGFVGTNVGGSAVSFKLSPNGSDSQGTIIFHKPHPEPNVNLIEQHNIGKRLRHRFGWTADTFVEREKVMKDKKAENEDAAEAQE